ncbi:MAG: choice-of-anchor L domain-containing protein [Bacteroidales bacterium]|jgi:uncharacterized protein (TIGR02145 family)
MRIYYFFLLLLLFFFSSNVLLAQLTVIQGAGLGMTPLQLVQSMLMGPGATISNVTYNGSSANITSNQIGSFQCIGGAYGQLGLSSGVIISSGTAIGAIGPNLTESFTGSIPNGAGDPDLTILADTITHDAAVIEFDYVPVSDTIQFKYVFGTEEFMFYCNQFNDPFGIFVSGPGISGPFSNNSIDIALLPGNNNYVTVNNLCSDTIPLWFNPQGGIYFQYNYLTYVLTAWQIIQPCQTYHIKIAISDAKDYALDAGAFLGQNNFSTAGFSVGNTCTHPELGHFAVAGCSDATVTIHLLANAIVNDTIPYTIGGTAVNGIDYATISDFVVIPAGSDSAFVTINPFMDIVPTGNKTVILGFQTLNCNGETTFQDTISIRPNYPLIVNLRNDTTICQNPITITASHTGGQAPYNYLWNTGSILPQITVTPSIGPNLYYVDVTDDCSSTDRDSVIITATNSPVITNTNLISSVCTGYSTNIVLQSSIPGSIFSWTATCGDPNISGYSAGSGPTITQPLNNTGTTIDTVTYHVFVTAIGCSSSQPKNFKVAVAPVPQVSYTLCTDAITTTDAVPFTLKGGLPFGGTYAGTGVNAGQFNPGASGTGSKTITYSYTNMYGCTNAATLNITVLNPPPFFCNNPVTDVRDNQQYPTVKLGTQCWMAANLNYGSQVPSSSMQWDNCIAEKYCLNDNSAKCSSLGGLYQWDELMQFVTAQSTKGLCPPSWHIPSENEWNELFSLYINNGFAGSPLKYSGYSGFNALLNGIRFDNRNWDFDTFASFFWSSTSQGSYKAWAHAMNSINPSVSYYPSNRSNAFYVRCIKN